MPKPKYRPDQPHPGKLPALEYEYDDETKSHQVRCPNPCGEFCATTDELVARRFVSAHLGEHARRRIVTPAEAVDNE